MTNESKIKVIIADWLAQLAADRRISLYDFRVAQRLGSKVRTAGLETQILRCRNVADSAAISVLVEKGYLLEVPSVNLPKNHLLSNNCPHASSASNLKNQAVVGSTAANAAVCKTTSSRGIHPRPNKNLRCRTTKNKSVAPPEQIATQDNHN